MSLKSASAKPGHFSASGSPEPERTERRDSSFHTDFRVTTPSGVEVEASTRRLEPLLMLLIRNVRTQDAELSIRFDNGTNLTVSGEGNATTTGDVRWSAARSIDSGTAPTHFVRRS